MTLNGKVLALFESHKGKSGRVVKDEIYLDGNGVVNDKFYAKDLERSVLISSLYSYTIAKKHEIVLDYGELGENIVLDLNPYSLKVGTFIKIGEVIVEVVQNCTICKSLEMIDSRLPKLLQNDRGIFVKVIQPGVVYMGSKVSIGG